MCSIVERYVLGELVGEGGMGRVYATTHPAPRPLVVKVLHEAFENDPASVARLRDEARLARLVSHRNVVRVIDDGITAAGTPYLVMERASGLPLSDLIERDGALALTRIRTIAAQILAALYAIHRAGLVHGDLKSSNVLVDDHDQVTIIDFGLARMSAARPAGLEEHMLSGTPEYMAPELARGEPLTPSGEIYSAGVIVYEMLTGSPPFGGGSVSSIFEAHLTDEVVPPSARVPERSIPAALESIVMRALSKKADARYLDAAFMATAIERAIPSNCREDGVPPARERSASRTQATRAWSCG
jgi:serine/threonine-protein kinase